MNCDQDLRWIARGDAIPADVLRDCLLRAMRHEAIADVLIERMVSRAERGNLDAHNLSGVLPELIGDVLDGATNGDWMAIADVLIEDMRESLLERSES